MQTLEQLQTKIRQGIKESSPYIDLSPGSVLSELLVKNEAIAQFMAMKTVEELNQGKVVSNVLANTDDTYLEAVDAIASNFNTYRNQGKKSAGVLTVVVNKAKLYNIPTSLTFVLPNLGTKYVTTKAVTVGLTGNEDVALSAVGQSFSFQLSVEAVDITEGTTVTAGTQFLLENPADLPEFVSASALNSFSIGQAKETDKQLVSRFRIGLSNANTLSSRAVNSLLSDVLPSFRVAKLVSSNENGTIRGKNNKFGMTHPGLVDVIVRTADNAATVTNTLTGVKQLSGVNTGKWLISIPATCAPGFYRVVGIKPTGQSTFGSETILSTTYGVDSSRFQNGNLVETAEEARFTCYQTAELLINSNVSGTTALFDVTFEVMPYLTECQNVFTGSYKIPGLDYLVRAANLCNVSVFMKAAMPPGVASTVVNIQKKIYRYVNDLHFNSELNPATLIGLAYQEGVNHVTHPVVVRATVYNPVKNQNVNVPVGSTVKLPLIPGSTITPDNTVFSTQFFNTTGQVNIGVQME
jgi:hypothetical protein